MENHNSITSNATQIQAETARFMSRVYAWMTFGVALTGAVSFYIMNTEGLLQAIVLNRAIWWGLIIAELGTVIFLSARIQKMNVMTASTLYALYSALTGATLSVLFFAYTRESIVQVFAITSIAFAGLSAVGNITKRDLGPIGSFCSMGLFGMVGWGLLSMFFPSMMAGALSPTYSVIGLIVFSGLTAYDTQKIKAMHMATQYEADQDRKGAIYGALILYLDFINLFLSLLRLMGNRR